MGFNEKISGYFKSDVINKLDEKEYLNQISLLVDLSFDLKRIDGLEDAIEKLNSYLKKNGSSSIPEKYGKSAS